MTMSNQPSDDSDNDQLNHNDFGYNSDNGSDLDDFIASSDDDNPSHSNHQHHPHNSNLGQDADTDSESEPEDRITKLNRQLKPNEDYSLKLLRAHISNLASSIGGPDHTSPLQPAPYKLGPDALKCLKDFKHWIRSVDVRKGTFDVALAISDVGLVNNDLIVILCQWDQKLTKLKKSASSQSFGNTMLHKISLVCLELLVQLTWPFEKTDQSTPNQVNHHNNLRKAQLIYKKQILSFNNGQTFKSLLRLALPALSQSSTDRDPKDGQILKLVLLFMRNILYLRPVDLLTVKKTTTSKADNFSNLPATVNEEDISLSSVINSFQKNKVLMFLQTITSGLGKDFDRETYGPIILESIFLMTRGVPIADLLSLPTNKSSNTHSQTSHQHSELQSQQPIPSSASVAGLQLQDLLKEESRREKISNEHIATRHGRFGSLLSVRNDDSSYVVSGQDALLNNHRTFAKLDNTKKWRARSQFNYDANKYVVNSPVRLTAHSSLILNQFIQMFLVSGNFNILIKSTASVLANSFYSMSSSNMLENVDSADRAHYFATVAWFLEYKRQRNDKLIQSKVTPLEDEDPFTYGSVGAGLSDVNFVLICQYMRESFGSRDWDSLHVALICLRELLLIAYSVFTSNPTDEQEQQEDDDEIEDRELAEGIIRKLFGEADYVNLLYQIPRSAYDHSPEYLSVVVQVVHILLKSFEKFANQDIKLFMKSKRRQTKRKKAAEAAVAGDEPLETNEPTRNYESDYDSEQESRQVITERQLDFRKNETQFFHKGTVTAHIVYLSRFEDLSPEDIKKALAFFHKLFVVRKDYTGLYRLDFMYTLYRVRNHLPRSSSVKQSVDEFIHYFMKKFKSAFARFPLPIELLFPRFEDLESKSFLATGNIYGDNLDYKDIDDDVDGESSSVSAGDRLAPGFIEEWIPEPKRAKDLMFAQHLEREQEIEVLVACLHQNEKDWVIEWLVSDLKRILENRLSDNSIDVLLPSPVIRRLLITDSHLRLLVEKLGFILPSGQNEPTILSREINRQALDTNIKLLQFVFDRVKKGERDPEVFQQLTKKKKVADKAAKKVAKPRKRRQRRVSSDSEGELELEDDVATKISKRYDPSAALKSHAMVSLSDDESDDEKESEFFQREEQLRALLQKSGGISDAQQLESFKKAWIQYEQMGLVDSTATSLLAMTDLEPPSRPMSPSKSPSKPIKPILKPDLVVSDHESGSESGTEEEITVTRSENGSQNGIAIDNKVNERKRPFLAAVESDDEDNKLSSANEDNEDAGNDTTFNKYVSAHEASSDNEPSNIDEAPTVRKRKRLVITDDEDED